MPAFTIPQPIKQFPGGASLPVLPSLSYREPREGKFYVPVNLQWDGAGSTFELDVRGLTTQPFSQIVMLDVDNSGSGAAVTFFFPDSSDTLVVPAESAGTFPVFTGGLLMYASSPTALASDVTRFRILNYRQEPLANPAPQFAQIATALGIVAAGTTAILAPSVTGTLVGYNFFVGAIGGVGVGTITVSLVQHTGGAVIDQAVVLAPASGYISTEIFNVSGTAIRILGGLDLVVATAGGPNININGSVRYRQP